MTAVTVAAAQTAVLAAAIPQPALRLSLHEATGHLLAGDVFTRRPLPPWTASSMDGYAVRSADLATGVTLVVSGGGDAGDPPPPPLGSGAAWRVATGGRVPVGADTVVRVEDTTLSEAGVVIHSERDRGRNVRPAGGDAAPGDVVLRSGQVISPAVVGLLAALGEANPVVFRRPRVAIITSGDEVVPLSDAERIASGERIADVNAPMLAALIAESGGVPVAIGLVPDTIEAMTAAVRAANDTDLVVTAGAISVGRLDHVPDAMAQSGAVQRFRRVRVRPGGPTTLAVLPDGRPWLALPGNPVSAFVTCQLFLRPMIRAMMGDPEPIPPRGRAALVDKVARDPVLDQYLRVTLDGGKARLTGGQGSWQLTSIVRADALALVEAGEGEVAAGEMVELLPLKFGWRSAQRWHLPD